MKIFLSILLIGSALAVSSQNEENNNVIQQHVNLDNKIGNYIKNPSIQINTRNINVTYTATTQKVRTRGNSSNSYSLNVEAPKVSPKRLEYFRIKTGNSFSGSFSHKPHKGHKSLQKKVLKPVKCWTQRIFKHTAKFQLSCTCFQF